VRRRGERIVIAVLSEALASTAAAAAGGEPAMMSGPAGLERLLSVAALVVGVVAASILMVGVLRGLASFVRGELRSGSGRNALLDDVRGGVGQYLLLGLELLVAADVMDTILTPSLDHVAVLAGVVLIRTVISFSLNWELARHASSRHGATATASAPAGMERTA
jgi:uncharacterized membrane protein